MRNKILKPDQPRLPRKSQRFRRSVNEPLHALGRQRNEKCTRCANMRMRML